MGPAPTRPVTAVNSSILLTLIVQQKNRPSLPTWFSWSIVMRVLSIFLVWMALVALNVAEGARADLNRTNPRSFV
jgi:hypothetical protein